MYSDLFQLMDTLLANQQKLTFTSAVWILDFEGPWKVMTDCDKIRVV